MSFLDKIMSYVKKPLPAKEGRIEMDSGSQILQGGVDGSEISDNPITSQGDVNIPPLVKEDAPIISEDSLSTESPVNEQKPAGEAVPEKPINESVVEEKTSDVPASPEVSVAEPELEVSPDVLVEQSVPEAPVIKSEKAIEPVEELIVPDSVPEVSITPEPIEEPTTSTSISPESITEPAKEEMTPSKSSITPESVAEPVVSEHTLTDPIEPVRDQIQEELTTKGPDTVDATPATSIEELEKRMDGPAPNIVAQEGAPEAEDPKPE